MPRARIPLRLSSGLVALVGVLAFGLNLTAATAAPVKPSPSSTASAKTVKKPPTVTFGLGPSNGKTLDGRPSFSYVSSPGATISDHVEILNISNRTLALHIYGTDAITTTSGAVGYQPRAAAHTGASTWLALPEHDGSSTFDIPAREDLTLPFQIRIPSNASPGDHSAGIAVGLDAGVTGKSAKKLTFEQRVIAQVYVRISGTVVARLAVKHLHTSYSGSVNPFGSGTVTVSYDVVNTGNVDLGATQKASLSGLFGSAGSVPKLKSLPDLLPGSTTRLSFTVPDVLPTFLLNSSIHVTPVALPNAADPKLVVASASAHVWAIPWALIILIIVLAVLAFVGRRYAKKRRASRPAPSHRRNRSKETNDVEPPTVAQPMPQPPDA